MKMTVGEAIIRFLDNQYVSFDGEQSKLVERVYTVFGHGCVLGAGEALAMAEHSLKVMQGKNEQGMAQAATAYAKQNNRRKIIPCFSSIGPGAANMVTAAATATVNNIPLLLFPGDTFASRQPDPVLQQVEQSYDAGITTNDAFKPVVKYFDRIHRPEMLMAALLNSMRVLTDPAETGAVCIALPQDVQGESYDFPQEFLQKRVHGICRNAPSAENVQAAAALIRNSRKPLVVVGGGARYSEAGQAITDFADKRNIPVAETQSGKSVIASSHPLNLGGIGVTGNLAANAIAAEADLIIGIGTRFSDFTTASKSLFSKAKVVTINTSRFHAMKLDAEALVGDAQVGVKALGELTKDYKSRYKGEIMQAKKAWQHEYDRLAEASYGADFSAEVDEMTPGTVDDFNAISGAEICQTAAIALIRKKIAADAIIVGASGSLPGCLQRMWTTDAPYTYNMEYGYSCMGYEIAGALGAKLACPDKEVYAMVGDGSYLMLHSEMVTAVQEKQKIDVLLFDNGGFGCINNLQMGSGIDSACTEFRIREGEQQIPKGNFLSIDYAMSARAYGFKGYTASTLEELEKALDDARRQTVCTLIDIKVLPKTMTHGYGGWWNTGCSTLPRTEKAAGTLAEKKQKLNTSRKY
ncbi:MAG: 3D-(3,5/4)-trihydroxycyclohexane-1,2-dione acylhydrolase (decyclizing) [Clostridia bacterium]|nr:3D-(3,5/4)-trihydroxycyclohexane-1,2-dione acylhydrolase (decyclizing) [Clostridia bacterium]